MNVWVIGKDRWHSAEIVFQGFEQLGLDTFQYTMTDSVEEFDANRLEDYPIVAVCRSNSQFEHEHRFWMNEDVQQSFERYVENGGSLLVIHAGTAGYQSGERFRKLIGGAFLHHPEACTVKICPESSHPIAAGVEEFQVHDEHYMMDWEKSDTELIMRTVSEHGEQPGGWTKMYGQGKICVLTPGHEEEVWNHPMFQKLLNNALHWCAE
ncbi:ThuA domain-containing protein [Saccharibacillus sp. JS10]|uniref:ThuA domain-containing protein n=1 Tax=Saccharibacillus sp. JS10 TaxID=2950552 RepID=UPI00210DEE9F|nr:ThuA domain-containing protein [Saccharibacillus sp. JS10]MCQ4088630.1 ThuA domain-containing protein [Saccharibacillus sp. JS10]